MGRKDDKLNKSKKNSKVSKKLNFDELEYVIYARKSTEDAWRQAQSIPDQVRICIDFAKNNWIKIKEIDSLYNWFKKIDENENTNLAIKWKLKSKLDEKDENDNKNLFIIRESKTWKIPWVREKWNELIRLVKAWKIKGILSYSPDRQARNILEWGEIINLIDEWKLGLKYTNFHFEDNASGKMMLWIWFVFSKQYSDKISEDGWRWSHNAAKKWEWLGIYKHWYQYDKKTGFHIKHPHNFELIKTAFDYKIDDLKTDKFILDFLKDKWYQREYTNWRIWFMNKSTLNMMWDDPFYYWKFIYWWNEIDLIEKNNDFEPMLTEQRFIDLVMIRWVKNEIVKTRTDYNVMDDSYDMMAIPNGMMTTEDWKYKFTFYIINKNRGPLRRLNKKIEETWNKNLKLKDVIKNNELWYSANSWKIIIKYDVLEKSILNVLKNIKITEEDYKWIIEVYKSQLKEKSKIKENEKKKNNLIIQKLQEKKDELLTINIWNKRDEEEEKIYQKEKTKLNLIIKEKEKENIRLNEDFDNNLFEFEIVLNFMKNAYQTYIKADFVQKRKIIEILFLHIKITPNNVIKFTFNEGIKDFFPKWQGPLELHQCLSASETDHSSS